MPTHNETVKEPAGTARPDEAAAGATPETTSPAVSGDPSFSGPRAPTLAYISGTGRSGSTLLSFLLNTHPEMTSIGEMHSPPFPRDRPDDRMCSCGRRMLDCELFSEVARRMASEGLEFDPREWDMTWSVPGRPRFSRLVFGSFRNTLLEDVRDRLCAWVPARQRARQALNQRIDRFFRVVLDITGTRVFVDANKDPIRIRFLDRLPDWDLRVIHLVRDPRGYVNSMMRDTGVDAADAARAWRRVNQNVERHLCRLPGSRWMRLNYESICADPDGTLRDLSSFLGVQPMEVPENFRGAPNHITGNKMAYDVSGAIVLDEKWRKSLKPTDLEAVAAVAGPMARRYGYEL